jgi:hypothetical protein
MFDGETIDHDLCNAHFLSFMDYLNFHNLHEPANAAQMIHINTVFKARLRGKARLWAEGKVFPTIPDLKAQFLHRFSPTHSNFGNVKYFNSLTHTQGETAEQTLNKIRLAAQRIDYNDVQVRDKFLQVLPPNCQAAVIMSAPPDAGIPVLVERAQQYLDFLPDNKSVTADTTSKQVSFLTDQVHMANATAYNIHTPAIVNASDTEISQITEQLAALRTDVQNLTLEAKAKPQAHISQSDGFDNSQNYRSNSPYPGTHNSRHHSRSPGRDRRRSHDRPYGNRTPSRSPGREQRFQPQYGNSPYRQGNSPRRSNIICYFCNKRNHVWKNCFLYQDMISRGMNPGYMPVRPQAPSFHPPSGEPRHNRPFYPNDKQFPTPYPFQPNQADDRSRFDQYQGPNNSRFDQYQGPNNSNF